ncbi:MAG: DUF5667 domain-containing protein [Bacillota bacterium]
MKKKIAALTVATSLVLGSFGAVALAENVTTTTTTPPQSVITVPSETATTTSTTQNQTTSTTTTTTTGTTQTTENTTPGTTTGTTTENTTGTTTGTTTPSEDSTQVPQATMWVTKLNIAVDSPFYPVLRALEQLQLFFTRAEEQKAVLNAELAAKRITEAQYLASKAEIDATAEQVTAEVQKLTEQTTKLMEEAQKRLEEAQKLLEQVPEQDADEQQDSEDLIMVVNQHRIEVLSRVYLKVPATAKPAIMKNLIKFGATQEQLEKLTTALEKQVEKLDEAVQKAEKANLTELKASTEAMKMTVKPHDDEKKADAKQLPPGQAKKADEQGKDKGNKANNGNSNGKGNGKSR